MVAIYHYAPTTKEFLRQTEARTDPLDGLPMIPAYATKKVAPNVGKNEVAVYEDQAWIKRPDFRGTTYWETDGGRVTITAIGQTVPPGASLTEPAETLADYAARVLREVTALASSYRASISDYVPEDRQIAWAIKAKWATIWRVFENSDSPEAQAMVDIARAGFSDEADITGEEPLALRDATIMKSERLFRALQVVEAMERVALEQVPTAQTEQELDVLVDTLRAQEQDAALKLQAILS